MDNFKQNKRDDALLFEFENMLESEKQLILTPNHWNEVEALLKNSAVSPMARQKRLKKLLGSKTCRKVQNKFKVDRFLNQNLRHVLSVLGFKPFILQLLVFGIFSFSGCSGKNTDQWTPPEEIVIPKPQETGEAPRFPWPKSSPGSFTGEQNATGLFAFPSPTPSPSASPIPVVSATPTTQPGPAQTPTPAPTPSSTPSPLPSVAPGPQPAAVIVPYQFESYRHFLLDARTASGTSPYPNQNCQYSSMTWSDQTRPYQIATMENVWPCSSTSGWNGTGEIDNPYRWESDGIDDGVWFRDLGTPLSTNFSLEVWIKPTRTISYRVSKTGGTTGQNYALYPECFDSVWCKNTFNSQTKFFLGLSVGTNEIHLYEHGMNRLENVFRSQNFYPNTWIHIFIVVSNNTPMVFLNGRHAGNGVKSIGTIYEPSMISIGQTDARYGPFQGAIGLVAFYNASYSDRTVNSSIASALCQKMAPIYGVNCGQ